MVGHLLCHLFCGTINKSLLVLSYTTCELITLVHHLLCIFSNVRVFCFLKFTVTLNSLFEEDYKTYIFTRNVAHHRRSQIKCNKVNDKRTMFFKTFFQPKSNLKRFTRISYVDCVIGSNLATHEQHTI